MDYELDQIDVEWNGRAYYAYGTVEILYRELQAEPDVGIMLRYNEVENILPYDDCYVVDVQTEEEIHPSKTEMWKILNNADQTTFNEAVNNA